MDRFLILENDNGSGQGFNPYHAENPHHAILTGHGWLYTHTTRITAVDGSKFAHHTYRFAETDWCAGVDMRPGFQVSIGRKGSGRRTVFFGASLAKYLRRKSRELAK